MRFGHIELFVREVPRARDFYVDVLGFELVVEQGPAGEAPRTVWVKLGETELLLRPGEPGEAAAFNLATANLVLYTDELEKDAALLHSRGLQFQGDDGPGCLTFTDPDGHWWQLVGPQGM